MRCLLISAMSRGSMRDGMSMATTNDAALLRSAGPILPALRLWLRFWPQLLIMALAGVVIRDLLLEIAIRIGFLNHLAGLVTLTFVVLAKLVIVILMFEVLRPALPALGAAREAAQQAV